MTRRRSLLFGLAAMTLVALLLVVIDAMRPTTSIPVERIEKLKTGMSRAEAEATIGMPPGDYTTRPSNLKPFKEEAHQMVWHTDDETLLLNFTIDGTLVQTVRITPNLETIWQRLRRRLGV